MYKDELIEVLLEMNMTLVKLNKVISGRLPSEEDCPLAPTQMMALIVLKNQPPINMTQLSELLTIPRQHLTKVADVLVSKELIERYTAPDNRKVVMVEITQNGREFLREFFYNEKSRLSRFIDILSSKQKDDFMEALCTIKRIISDAEKEHKVTSPIFD